VSQLAFNEDTFYIGIDIGSVSIKIGVISHARHSEVISRIAHTFPDLFETENSTLLWQNIPAIILVSRYQRIKGEPFRAAVELLQLLLENLPPQAHVAITATGAGGKRSAQILNIPYQNEFRAIARGIGALHPDIRTVLEMGGDSSKFIILNPDSGATGILDYEVNGDCAAGTGSFIDQQASRLLYRIEEVGDVVLKAGKPASIAGRCSVFAKSDMIHAQQKGFQPGEILKGLCQAVVRNFKGAIIRGKEILPPVAFIGGVAANNGIVQALREILKLNEETLIVPRFFNCMEAIGSALLIFDGHSSTTTAQFRQSLGRIVRSEERRVGKEC
jgi:activator of 2-hydroxyglutaryl-CoA dehydratase